jgi:hypothetical protein
MMDMAFAITLRPIEMVSLYMAIGFSWHDRTYMYMYPDLLNAQTPWFMTRARRYLIKNITRSAQGKSSQAGLIHDAFSFQYVV